MFAVRGIIISFSIFILLYSVLSVAIGRLWSRVWRCSEQGSQRRCADALLFLRIAPLAVAAGVTLILAVPSFLLLEPRSGSEPMGLPAFALGILGIAAVVAGIWNAAAAFVRASRMIALWSTEASIIGSSPVGANRSVCVFRSPVAAPPLTAAGIMRPTVWLSRAAEFVLTERELHTALRHEAMHVSRRDNLRKLIMRAVAFPGMAGLESAWRETTEMAADDAAVSSASEALDLAAAVIKLSRLASLQPPAELSMALVHSPAASVNARVERLIAWKELRQPAAMGYSLRYAACAAVAAVVSLVVTYSALLVRMHAATEWLVR